MAAVALSARSFSWSEPRLSIVIRFLSPSRCFSNCSGFRGPSSLLHGDKLCATVKRSCLHRTDATRRKKLGRFLHAQADLQTVTNPDYDDSRELNLLDAHAVAIEAVARACQICMEVQSQMATEEAEASWEAEDGYQSSGEREKDDRTPVTVADFAVQALIALELSHAFPAIRMVAEEDSSLLRHDFATRINSGFSLAGSADKGGMEPLAVMVSNLVSRFASQPVRETMAGRGGEGGRGTVEGRRGDGREAKGAVRCDKSVSVDHSSSPAARYSYPSPPHPPTTPNPISPDITAVLSALDESSAAAAAVAAAAAAAASAASSNSSTDDSYYWVLDPIDGTRGFLNRGNCQYVVGLALVHRGEVKVSVMGLPNMPLPGALQEGGRERERERNEASELEGAEGLRSQMDAMSQSDSSCGGGARREKSGSASEQIATAAATTGCSNCDSSIDDLPSRVASMWQSPRGVIIAAVKGGGAHVMRIPDSGNDMAGTDEGNERREGMVRANVSGVEREEDRVGASVKDRERQRRRVLRVCISDHETWEDLPLAQGLAIMAEREARGGVRAVEGMRKEGRHEQGGEELQVAVVDAEPLPLCCGSLCKYAAVALGYASVFIQHPPRGQSHAQLKTWDHAAGVLCVEEAGGKVTDFGRGQLDFSSDVLGPVPLLFSPHGGGVVVTNRQEHSLVLEGLSAGLKIGLNKNH